MDERDEPVNPATELFSGKEQDWDIWAGAPSASYLDCLVLAQFFETLWAYYSQSDGVLHHREIRRTGKALAEVMTQLFGTDLPDLAQDQAVQEIVRTLAAWSTDNSGGCIWPYENLDRSHFVIRVFLGSVKAACLEKMGCHVFPHLYLPRDFERSEAQYSAEATRWAGHLPAKVLEFATSTGSNTVKSLMDNASKKSSIVVIGDIRRSQDLMTYSMNEESFSRHLLDLMELTQDYVLRSGGIFDKFTGDGFVAYFNEEISNCGGSGSYTGDFLRFIERYSARCDAFFAEWVQAIRKMPPGGIGMAIGADIGPVFMQHTRGHLMAVGDAVVWATRMAAEAEANESLINNALYHTIKNTAGVTFTERAAKTKTGEDFLARSLRFAR